MGSNIDVVRRQIQLLKDTALSPQAFVKLHAQTARNARAEVETEQGKYPTTIVVDGRKGASEDSVKFGGVIQYEFHPAGDVIDAAYEELLRTAPVKTGNYAKHIWMYVNGKRRDAATEGATIDLMPGDEVIFIDAVPYARKIEGGIKKRAGERTQRRPGLSAQAPNGVFEVTAKELKRRFGNYPVAIGFDYRALLDGAAVQAGEASKSIRGKKGRFISNGKAQRANRSENRWPCIEIKVL